jgi:copper chaperone CopZ
MATVTLRITGMACGGCANAVAQALRALPGVEEAVVSHAAATAEIRFDPAQVQLAQLKSAVERAGYQVAD